MVKGRKVKSVCFLVTFQSRKDESQCFIKKDGLDLIIPTQQSNPKTALTFSVTSIESQFIQTTDRETRISINFSEKTYK